MCGIVGFFTKNRALEPELGDHLSSMLIEMTDRGPDSAGVAVYRAPVADGGIKLSLFSGADSYPWQDLAGGLGEALGAPVEIDVRGSHAVVAVQEGDDSVGDWLAAHHPDVAVVASGSAIEIFKEMGRPADVVERLDLRSLDGSHGLGHTRMATESEVTTAHSHPFAAGRDLCLVHNGSLSNHNRLRQDLRRKGMDIRTDNDTEVAAAFLAHELGNGATIEEALEAALHALDGFYTFAVGTRDGFAVLRDPFACKHAVLAETDDWLAMATEYRSIARLPGAESADIWEPEPARVYSWNRGRDD